MEPATALAPVIDTVALAEIVHQAPAILAENQTSRDKAVQAGQNFLQQANNGMNDQLDTLMSQYLDKVRITHKTINERRKPFTQLVQEVVKRFTSLEADIDPASKTNIFFQIQSKRNEYAAAKIAEQQKREREAKDKLEKEKEIISIRSFAESSLRQAVLNYTSSFKQKMISIFESLTLDTVDHGAEQFAGIEQINPALLPMPQTPLYTYTKPEEIMSIMVEVRSDEALISELKETYKAEVVALRKELIDKLPSKKAELQAIASASAEESKRLFEAAEKRKQEEALRLQKEAEDRAKQAQEDALAKEQAQQLDAAVNTQAELFQETPKVKEGCELIIKNTAAWQLVFMFWWEREGKTLPSEKIEKMTMLRMKTFCENQAVKTGEEINSQLVEYKITYKAK